MKNLSYLLLFLAGTLALTSCGKDDPAPIEVGSVELNETTLTLAIGDVYNLKATVLPDNAENKTVVWRSSDKNVVDVSDAGRVTALAAGTATVTATASGKSATCTVTVLPIEVESVTLDRTELALIRGGSETLTATVLPADAADKTVAWRSSDNAIAAVDDTGRVEALAVGTATVTATAGGKSAACTVTVLPIEVESIELDKSQLTFMRGENYSLKVTVLPADADGIVTWQSSATNIATVSEKGLVTAVNSGTATVTATAGGKSATCTVKVEPDIYAVGHTGVKEQSRLGIVWKNGVADQFPCSEANSVFVSDGDVYISGQVTESDTFIRTVWFKNDDLMENYRENFSSSIFVRNGDVYMAGGDPGAKIWKNGDLQNLTQPDISSAAYGLFVSENNDVYVAGKIQGSSAENPCYWKNGELHVLSESTYGGSANSIVVKGGVVYACGAEKTTRSGYYEGIVWIDGVAKKLSGAYTTSQICVTDNKDIYVSGLTSDAYNPAIWKNGELIDLSSLELPSHNPPAICVFGEDVYIAGTTKDKKSFVWKDGVATPLQGDGYMVNSIFVY